MAANKLAKMVAAALTATAMTVGGTAPTAQADVDLGAVTTGPLFGLAQAFGVTTITIEDVDVIGNIFIHTAWAPPLPKVLADSVNAFPFDGFAPVFGTFRRQPGGSLGSAILAGSGLSAYNAGIAYQALLSSAGGDTWAGYTPLEARGKVNSLTGVSCTVGPTCIQGTNVTNLAVAQINDPGTPNGGIFARFSPILDIFGIDGVSKGGDSASSTGIALNAATVGLALGYNLTSDFPATLNPVSLLNSVVATLLPTHLLSGATLAGDSEDLLYARLGVLATLGVPSTSYSTLVAPDLPLLEPLRLPSRIINLVANAIGLPLNLGTPLADALQPALSILVNTGYTDVATPTDGGTYNRTYKEAGTLVPYLSQAPLTPAEWLQVPGDVVRALVVGFQNAFPILRFGQTAPVLTVDGNHLAITYPPATATVTPPAAARASVGAGVSRPVSRQSAKPGGSQVKQAKPARAVTARGAR